MYSYQSVPTSKLRPDPEQPRKYINEDSIKEMSVSIKNEGVVNAIEVDENYIIITGERRWRAATLAGLKEVPVKVIDNLSPSERFIRQVQENIHQNTMSPWDTAVALEKIRKEVTFTGKLTVDKPEKGGGYTHGKPGVLALTKLLGTPEATISQLLDLLSESGEMKKALQTPGFQRTKVRVINKETPEKYKEKLRHVVATQMEIPRDTVQHIARALRRADTYNEPEKAEKLLSQDFRGLTILESMAKIDKIIPNDESRVKEPADALRMVTEKVVEIMELLDEHPLESFDVFHGSLLKKDLQGFGTFLAKYLGYNTGKKLLTKGE